MIISKSSRVVTVFASKGLGLNPCFDYFQYTHLLFVCVPSPG